MARCRKPPTLAFAYISPARSSKRRMRSIVESHSLATSGSGSGWSAIGGSVSRRRYNEGVRAVSADLDISPERAWDLYAHPRAWPAWAPHMRGAWGLTNGAGEVKPGARGVVWLGLAPIPVKRTGGE